MLSRLCIHKSAYASVSFYRLQVQDKILFGAVQTRRPAVEAATHVAAMGPLQHTVAFEGQPAQVVIVTVVGAGVGAAQDAAAVGVDICAESVSVRLPEQHPYTVRCEMPACGPFDAAWGLIRPVTLLHARRWRFPSQ